MIFSYKPEYSWANCAPYWHINGEKYGFGEEAFVSTESYVETNANPCAKLRPKLFFKNHAAIHDVELSTLFSRSNVFSSYIVGHA